MLSRVVYKRQRGRRLATALAAVALISGHPAHLQRRPGRPRHRPVPARRRRRDGHEHGQHSGRRRRLGQGLLRSGHQARRSRRRRPLARRGGGPVRHRHADDRSRDRDVLGVRAEHQCQHLHRRRLEGPPGPNKWPWKDAGGLPDKDNLLHSFAARYSLAPSAHCPAGTFLTCDVLYFGLDRNDNSGDAQNGFWFFQSKVTTAGGSVGGGTGFTGLHQLNDVLVVSDFSNGGTISTISVYTWNRPDRDQQAGGLLRRRQPPPAGVLDQRQLRDPDPARDVGDRAGLVNPSTITMPWAFTDKSGTRPTRPSTAALRGRHQPVGARPRGPMLLERALRDSLLDLHDRRAEGLHPRPARRVHAEPDYRGAGAAGRSHGLAGNACSRHCNDHGHRCRRSG